MTYDPSIGRWLSEDPIGFAGGTTNLTEYVGNSPLNYTDPTGLAEVPLKTPYDLLPPFRQSANASTNYLANGGTFVVNADVENSTSGKHMGEVTNPLDPLKQKSGAMPTSIRYQLRVSFEPNEDYADSAIKLAVARNENNNNSKFWGGGNMKDLYKPIISTDGWRIDNGVAVTAKGWPPMTGRNMLYITDNLQQPRINDSERPYMNGTPANPAYATFIGGTNPSLQFERGFTDDIIVVAYCATTGKDLAAIRVQMTPVTQDKVAAGWRYYVEPSSVDAKEYVGAKQAFYK